MPNFTGSLVWEALGTGTCVYIIYSDLVGCCMVEHGAGTESNLLYFLFLQMNYSIRSSKQKLRLMMKPCSGTVPPN